MPRKRKKMSKNYLSFFSGALGLDLGLEAAGLHPLAVNEIDPIACETIRRNRPGLRLLEGDIRLLSADRLRRDLDFETEELFAIVGGPPCQAFSTAGRRLGLNDDRGNVFLHFIALIQRLRPKFAVFENVRGLLSAPLNHRPHSQRGSHFAELDESEKPGGALLHILRLLEDSGYITTFTLYNMANYGVPQSRERLIFFACRDGEGVPFIPPTHSEAGEAGLLPWKTVKDAFAGLNVRHTHGKFSEKRMKYLRMLREGENWRNLPRRIQREAMGKSWESGGGKTGFYRRLAWDRPSPTLVTRPTMPATFLCHPEELRPLSVEEYAAIQTFPMNYKFSGKIDDQYRQIGNAVPPLFAKAVGHHILDFEAGKTEDVAGDRLSRYVNTDHLTWRTSLERPKSLPLF
jgi:DNA (cytosine-5)-methyltransferase 1